MNANDHVLLVTSMIWQYPREDLIVTGRFYQVVGWFQDGYILKRRSSQRSKRRLLLKGRTPKSKRLRYVPGPYIGEFLADGANEYTLGASP